MSVDLTEQRPRSLRTFLRRRWKRITATTVGLGALVGFGPLLLVLAESHGRTYTDASQVPARDVALVLGAQVYPSGQPSPYLAGRLDRAAELFRAGTVKVIIVSGDNGTTHYDEPTSMQKYLVAKGIPADKIVLDYAGFDTYASCVRAKKILGVTKLVVISQSYHVPRAVATCRLVGVDAIGLGDRSVNTSDGTWRSGQAREVLADIKMVLDVTTDRTPLLGPRETTVDEALRKP